MVLAAAVLTGVFSGTGMVEAATYLSILLGTVTAGWIVTEAGRQPFTVYGHLTTANSVAPIGAPAVATSLVALPELGNTTHFSVAGLHTT